MLNFNNFFNMQWNPVNSVTNGPQKSGGINTVAVLKGFFQ